MRARQIVIAAIRAYQRAVSPYVGDCCRFHPSCSEYAARSVALNGVLLGSLAGLWRILRCHPFHPGGVDPPRVIHIPGHKRAQWKNA